MVPYGPLLTGRSTVVAARAADLAAGAAGARAARLPQQSPARCTRSTRSRPPSRRCAIGSGRSASPCSWAPARPGIAAGEDAADALAATGRMPATYHYRQQEIGSPAEFAARYLGLDGLRYTISTACSSSAKAFASAQRLLAAGRCDAAIVGGADSLCRLTLNGFDALESLARGRCNPFSLNRNGINIGEGACVFVAHARACCGPALRRRRVVRRLPHLRARPVGQGAPSSRSARRSRTPASRRPTSATSICTARPRRRTTRWRAK